MQKNPLILASDLVEALGSNAEFVASDNMEAALAAGDAASFEEWRLVAKSIAFLTRQDTVSSDNQNIPVRQVTLPAVPVELKRARG